MTELLYGAVEAGGTKFVCAAANGGTIIDETRFATNDPHTTLGAVERFFAGVESTHGPFASFGIATFGPVDLRPVSPTFGQLLATPKQGWTNAALSKPIAMRFRCPVAIDTDVNAAALAEAFDGAGQGCGTVAYVTVGTGIGGGVVVQGRTLKGLLHPEMGHIRVLRDARDQGFPGVCPFHGDCLEGLASGTAIVARYGVSLDRLPPDHDANQVIGQYLGQLTANLILTLSAERVIFGGGVMKNEGLFPRIRLAALEILNGYPSGIGEAGSLERVVVAPGLGERSGLLGALRLAQTQAFAD